MYGENDYRNYLAHARGHKYILKLGQGPNAKYFYTREEIQAYTNARKKASEKIKNTISNPGMQAYSDLSKLQKKQMGQITPIDYKAGVNKIAALERSGVNKISNTKAFKNVVKVGKYGKIGVTEAAKAASKYTKSAGKNIEKYSNSKKKSGISNQSLNAYSKLNKLQNTKKPHRNSMPVTAEQKALKRNVEAKRIASKASKKISKSFKPKSAYEKALDRVERKVKPGINSAEKAVRSGERKASKYASGVERKASKYASGVERKASKYVSEAERKASKYASNAERPVRSGTKKASKYASNAERTVRSGAKKASKYANTAEKYARSGVNQAEKYGKKAKKKVSKYSKRGKKWASSWMNKYFK